MKFYTLMLGLFVPCSSAAVNPVGKVLEMISKIQQDVVSEGEEEQTMYNEFSEMCSDRSRELHQEIKTAKGQVAEFEATIAKATAELTALEERIDDVSSETADAENELKKATDLRTKDSEDFKAEEKELMGTTSTLQRAIAITERGTGASLAQVENMKTVTRVLQTMVEASAVESYDTAKLTALMQASSQSSEESDEDETGAPSAATYEGHSGGVVELLEDLLDKSQNQLDEAREAETKARHTYDLMKQSLSDRIKTLTTEMAEVKKDLAATKEELAMAEGSLETTKKDLAADVQDLEDLHRECMDKATSFEDSASSRNEELKALAEAKKVILESTGGAVKQSYDLAQTSFLQLSSAPVESASKVLHALRRLATGAHSAALVALSNHVSQAIRRSAVTGGDPFDKVKSLLDAMLTKLLDEAESEATKKAYCDKELAESQANKENKETDVEELTTKIDLMTASSKKLKEEVANLGKELATLYQTQGEMDKLRAEERGIYEKNKPVMEQGLEGIKTALRVLRDYYAIDDKSHHAKEGAGGGVIGMLEVVESDFTKNIAEMTSAEETAESEYEDVTKENEIDKAAKEQDAKHKTAQHVQLDKSISEMSADRIGAQEELDAVKEYFGSIQKECIAKPDPYDERKKRREEEIAGLKEAMGTLQGEAALLQRSTLHKTLRGAGRLVSSE